jgi:carbonic anhydrase
MPNKLNPEQVIAELRAGNRRFLEGKSAQTSESSLKKLSEFAEKGQVPKAIVLCCSDSRAPVEMIFDQDIGDLFVVRVAGNIIAPSLVGSVEFAAGTFGTGLVVVMGHTQCGAITATLDYIEDPEAIHSANIQDIVGRIKPHIQSIADMRHLSRGERVQRAVEANVRDSVSQLSSGSSALLEGLVRQGKMKIAGAVLELATGEVRFLET